VANYCEPRDLYRFGLQRGAIPNPGRLAESVSASADAITLDVHGFSLNDLVSFRADASGSLPSPLVAGTSYYAIPLTESTFSVSATEDGDAVDLTTAGSRVLVIAPLSLEDACAFGSRLVDDCLPAHVVPLESPYPELVVMTAAELAIWKATTGKGSSKTLTDMVDQARKRLERWAKGVPIRDENAPAPANLAVGASAALNDPRGWTRFGGL
jgi:hypothetical protein